jgi:hypothetical protein
VYSLLQPEALKRLNKTEQDNSAKVLICRGTLAQG